MFEERTQQGRLCSTLLERGLNGLPEVGDIRRNVVGQVGVLGSVPDLFVGIEVGSTRRGPIPRSSAIDGVRVSL